MKKFKKAMKAFSIVMLLFAFTIARAQTNAAVQPASAENRIAILPISYIADGNPVKLEEMRFRLQNLVYLFLKNKAVELKLQDPAETNALLLKKGVKASNMREYTPKDLAAILEVEYVITGMVMQESTGKATIKTSHRNNDDEWRENRETVRRSTTKEELSTNIDLAVHNNKGEQLYSKSRTSIWSTNDAYKPGLEYLLKRSPVYKR